MNARLFIKRNSATILSFVAVAGVVATAITSANATPKAVRALDTAKLNKGEEELIRSIWNDDELYTIHQTVDSDKAKQELQGSNTGANFGENYIKAEAILTASLYAREKYKGSGSLKSEKKQCKI